MIVATILGITALLYFVWRFSFFIPAPKGIPILMYHKVSLLESDSLTVTRDELRRQFSYLKRKAYTPISFADLQKIGAGGYKLPSKPIIITFDDAYVNNLELALPVLTEFGFKATIFVPTASIGKSNNWDGDTDKLMNVVQLHELVNSGLIELGMHSHNHQNFKTMTLDEIVDDLDACMASFEKVELPYTKTLAYPYGAYHRKDEKAKNELFELFKRKNIDFAVRIGNRINKFPLQTRYELKRIDIRGNQSFFEFRIKVKKGRAKLF